MAKEVVIETVTMEDGRVMDFPGKRRLLKKSIIDAATNTVQVQLDFRNGQTRLFTLPENLLLTSAAHGIEQKLGDETAGLTSLDDAVLAIDELIDRLYNGEWNSREGGNSMAGTSVLMQALIQVSGKSRQEVRDFLRTKSQAEKMAMRQNNRLAPVIAEIEAKRSQNSTIDAGNLLSGLLGDEGEPAAA